MILRGFLISLTFLLLANLSLAGEVTDVQLITEGVEYFKIQRYMENGVAIVHVLKIDPDRVEVIPVLPQRSPSILEKLIEWFGSWIPKGEVKEPHFNRATVSTLVKQGNAIAGVNGTYFAEDNRPLGTLMIDEELISFPIYDRTALILSSEEASIDNVFVDADLTLPDGSKIKISGFNRNREKGEVVLYTFRYGKKTDPESAVLELTVMDDCVTKIKPPPSEIHENGIVIAFDSPYAEYLWQNLKVGDKIDLNLELTTFSNSNTEIKHILGGGPRLLKSGVVYLTYHEEKFRPGIRKGRHARTAVGITEDGKLLLVTVDKEKGISSGMRLEELSGLMRDLGAQDAMNLDGGGSSTMVIRDRVINHPVYGSEIKVGNALIIRRKF